MIRGGKMRYFERGLSDILDEALAGFPAVLLHGARQVGKTTLLRRHLGDDFRYVSVERPQVRQLAADDPAGFLDLYRPPVILDEIQFAPQLMPYIKERIDSDRRRMGQYVLTGSHNLLMMQQVSETLAGRTAVLQLHPLSRREMDGDAGRLLPWDTGGEIRETSPDAFVKRVSFCERLLAGGYPDVATGSVGHRRLWFDAYVQTYLERDVRQLRQVGDLRLFQSFIKAVALRNGQLFNMSDVGRDLGLSVNTVKAWVSVLEASGLVFVLNPYFANGGKRLVKTPKVYFADSGLLCHLAGISSAEELALSPFGGAVMESAVLLEIRCALSFRGVRPDLYFWRTSNGTEVDIVVPFGRSLVPVDVKLSGTPKSSMATGIRVFREVYAEAERGWLIHSGDVPLPLGNADIALPFDSL